MQEVPSLTQQLALFTVAGFACWASWGVNVACDVVRKQRVMRTTPRMSQDREDHC